MPNRDVVVIGASAGGIEALQELCSRLPADLDAAIMITMHVSAYSNGLLPRVLSRSGPLKAIHPRQGEAIKKGQIYIAPPDFHLLVERGALVISQGPRENHNRPAIDPLFRSAAVAYGPRVIGVVLTGLLDDGTSGLMVIRAHGGAAVVQDPKTAMFPSMPTCALERVPDAAVRSLAEIPKMLLKLTKEQVDDIAPSRSNGTAERETKMAEVDMSEVEKDSHVGKPSPFACPECGGVLWEIDQEGLLRFRCRVGHAYTARHLETEQRQATEAALWSALRALEESASMYRRMAQRARSAHQDKTQATYEERAATANENARNLRNFLLTVSLPEAQMERELEKHRPAV